MSKYNAIRRLVCSSSFLRFHRFDKTALSPDIHIDEYAEATADIREIDRVSKLHGGD
jgi:hypothetical protein